MVKIYEFVTRITGCKDCPYEVRTLHHDGFYRICGLGGSVAARKLLEDNYLEITPSCPLFYELKELS